MRRERSGSIRALPVLLLTVLLFGLAPAPAPARAQPAEQGGFVATGNTSLATPDLRMPSAPEGAPASALRVAAGMVARPSEAGLAVAPAAFADRAPTLQAGTPCEPLLTNATLDNGYDWVALDPVVNLGTGAFYSAPNSLWVWDTSDQNEFDQSPSQDAFGQDFLFPADAASALIEFQIFYEDVDAADHVFYEFYGVDINGNLIDANPNVALINPFGQGEVGDLQPNSWNYIADFLGDEPGEDQIIADAKSYGRIALVLRTFTDNLPPFEAVSFDNIQVTACRSTSLPQGQVIGQVSGAANPSDARLALFNFDSAGDSELVDVTTPDAAGNYAFRSLYPPAAGNAYQVWYINTGTDDRLSYWAGPPITSFVGDQAAGGNFSIADLALLGPTHYDKAAFPATFTWQTRGLPGEAYYLCIYDADTFSEVCTTNPISGGSYRIDAVSALQGIPGFTFAYGKRYGWYVRLTGPGYDGKRFAQIGASGYSRFVSFTQQAQTPVTPPPSETTPPPTGDPDQDRWTILFYLAGDDEQLTHGPAGARDMVDVLTNLSTLGDSFPNVNIVAQFDFYETAQRTLPAGLRGTQRCYFRPGVLRLADACQQLGELNTGDPATLTSFLNATLARYPAERTMLVIMGHGSTISGVAGDQTQPAGQEDDALHPEELEKAFSDADLDNPARKLDAIVFYACLMGSFETAAIISPFADYMVASPNITTLIDINRQIIDRAAKSADPRAVAEGVVQEYDAALTRYNQTSPTKLSISMAAYDLRQVAAARPRVDALGAALLNNLSLEPVRAARAAVQLYDSSAPLLWGNATQKGEDALVDLRDLANRIARANVPAEVKVAAQALCTSGAGCQNGLGGLVVRSVGRDGRADLSVPGQHLLANSLGLAIYFPNNSSEGNQAALTNDYLLYYRQTGFRSSQWVSLVNATLTGLPSLPRRSSLGSAGAGRGGTLQNFTAPESFPVISSLPRSGGGARLYLPLLRR